MCYIDGTEVAAEFIGQAELIAESLKLGMFGLPNPASLPTLLAPRWCRRLTARFTLRH